MQSNEHTEGVSRSHITTVDHGDCWLLKCDRDPDHASTNRMNHSNRLYTHVLRPYTAVYGNKRSRQYMRPAAGGVDMALTTILSRTSPQFRAFISTITALLGYACKDSGEPDAASIPGNDEVIHRAGQEGTVISIVTIAIIALVGIAFISKFAERCPASGQLSQSCQSISKGIGTSLPEAVGPIPLLAALILLLISISLKIRS